MTFSCSARPPLNVTRATPSSRAPLVLRRHYTSKPAETLIADHRKVSGLLDKIKRSRPASASADAEGVSDIQNQRKSWAREVIREVSGHSVVEEQVVYPLVRNMEKDGDAKIDHSIAEHKEVAEIMLKLENCTDMAEFDNLINTLDASLTHHIKEEEANVLPRLDRLTTEQQRSLSGLIDSARQIAPTHPHPYAPHTPPANVILGPVASLIDNVKDSLGLRQPLDKPQPRDV